MAETISELRSERDELNRTMYTGTILTNAEREAALLRDDELIREINAIKELREEKKAQLVIDKEKLRVAKELADSQKLQLDTQEALRKAAEEAAIKSAVVARFEEASQVSLEDAMVSSMDRIAEQAKENRLAREQEARDSADALLAIERESHINRKRQRTAAAEEETIDAQTLQNSLANAIAIGVGGSAALTSGIAQNRINEINAVERAEINAIK